MTDKICSLLFKVMTGISFIITIIFLAMPPVAQSSVTYDQPSNQITVNNELAPRDLPWLYNQLHNDSLLKYEGKIWYLNATLSLNNSTMIIDSSTVTELRMANYYNGECHEGEGLKAGDFRISNTKITSWNWARNQPADYYNLKEPQVDVNINGGYVYNTDLSNIRRVQIISPSQDIHDIVRINGRWSTLITNANNIKVYNYVSSYIFEGGIWCIGCTYTKLKNITQTFGGNSVTGGGGGVVFEGGHDNSMENVYVNTTSWMGVEANTCAYNIKFRNVTVENAGHNGLDLHGARNVYVENMTIRNSKSNNFFITSSGCDIYDASNITLKNVYSYKAGSEGGDGANAGPLNTKVQDITFINFYSEDDNNGMNINNLDSIKVFNMKVKNAKAWAFASGNTPSKVIDSDLTNNSSIYVDVATTSKFINVKYSNIMLHAQAATSVCYYPDVLVKDSLGTPISNASVVFANEINPSFSSLDGLGNNKAAFYTTCTGHTAFPSQDRANSPALIAEYRSTTDTGYNVGISTYFTWNITATAPDGKFASVSGISPDATWYRANPNISTGTIVIEIPTTVLSDITEPSAITDLSAGNAWADQLTLTWSAPGEDGNAGTAAQYDLRYSTALITDANWNLAISLTNGISPKAGGSPETLDITGLNPATTYYFAIKTADEVPLWSLLSNVAVGITDVSMGMGNDVPSAPLQLQAIAGDSQIALSWQAPGYTGRSSIVNYKIYRDNANIATLGDILSYLDKGLSNGVTYYYQVSAVNVVGEGTKSYAASAVPFALQNPDVSGSAEPYIYPVPYIYSKKSVLTFANLPVPSKIEIYTLDGTLLFEKETDTPSYRFIPADFSSGVYVYLVKSAQGTKSGKIVIIR